MATGAAWTEVILDANERNLLIGKNGSGKSQMIDAITFALYNKAFRDVNKPDLINSINDKDSQVELELSVLGTHYKIIRTQKMNTFELWKDGVSQNKTGVDDLQTYLEKQVVKMNFKTFCQVVILGSTNYIPFMQLPAAQRREVNESLLDLQSFSIMNVLLKGKIGPLTKEIQQLQTQENQLTTTCELYRSQLAKMNQDNEGHIMDLMLKIGEIDGEIERVRATVTEEVRLYEELISKAIDPAPIDKRLNEMASLKGSFTHQHSDAKKTINFFTLNSVCPTCAQDINEDHKAEMVAKCSHTVEEMTQGLEKLTRLEASARAQLTEARAAATKTNEHRTNIQRHNVMVDQLLRQRQSLDEQVARLKQPTTALATSQDDLVAAQAQLLMVQDQLAEKKATMDHYEVAQGLLKDDGIKATILSKYIPIINQQVNAYLAAMNFFVGFEMNEVFEVTFKSRFRDKFKYAMFSEGQKARIDLALMMTWRDIAKLKNSVSSNLLIMDEVFDGSLDTEGSEELMQILNTLTGENVWVISHKDLYVEKFDKVYRFILENNFSQMVEVK